MLGLYNLTYLLLCNPMDFVLALFSWCTHFDLVMCGSLTHPVSCDFVFVMFQNCYYMRMPRNVLTKQVFGASI